MIGYELAIFYGFLGNAQNSLRPQHGVVGPVNVDQDVRARGGHIFFLCLRVQAGAFYQFMGPAEVGDELVNGDSVCESVVDNRIV